MLKLKLDYNVLLESNAFCSCCEEADYDENNQILFCDGCDVAVHQECYHTQFSTESKWFCQRCEYINEDGCCVFCPETHMALEKIVIKNEMNETNFWAHSSCLKWHPNIQLIAQSLNLYEGTPYLTQYPCSYCHIQMGYQVQCNYIGCDKYFHIGCLKIKGGILNKEQMDNLQIIMQPYSKQQNDKQYLYCVEHIQNNNDQENRELIQKFLEFMNYRVNNFYNYNNRTKETIQQTVSIKQQEPQTNKKTRNFEETLFEDMFQNKQFKDLKVPIKDKKTKQQFKEYMKKKLNESLHRKRDEFFKANNCNFSEEDDIYIQLDIPLSKKLFDVVVDINNLEAFDSYLVNYFIYNNMIDKFHSPCIRIREDQQNYKFWKSILDELHIRNGDKLASFLNELRFKKMCVVSKKIQKDQNANVLLEHFNIQDDVEVVND